MVGGRRHRAERGRLIDLVSANPCRAGAKSPSSPPCASSRDQCQLNFKRPKSPCATTMLDFPSRAWYMHNILCGRCTLQGESVLNASHRCPAHMNAFTVLGGLDDAS